MSLTYNTAAIKCRIYWSKTMDMIIRFRPTIYRWWRLNPSQGTANNCHQCGYAELHYGSVIKYTNELLMCINKWKIQSKLCKCFQRDKLQIDDITHSSEWKVSSKNKFWTGILSSRIRLMGIKPKGDLTPIRREKFLQRKKH